MNGLNRRSVTAGIIAVGLLALTIGLLLGGGTATVKAQDTPTSDLVVGLVYQVADFATCSAPNGSLRKEWHFGGADRSRRNQLTPEIDGRGRKIFRVVLGDRTLPPHHLRLRQVVEADPTLEGHNYGSYTWSGVVVEYNGYVGRQRSIGPCGPAR